MTTGVFPLSRRLAAEAVGTGLLVATVVGSGIMAQSLTRDVALQLLCNGLATGAALVVLISILGPISGAHFNPAVSLVSRLDDQLSTRDAAAYVMAQIAGGMAGVMVAHWMFGLSALAFSATARTGAAQGLSEVVATFGLVSVICAA